MKKKIITLLMIIVLCIAVCGCSSANRNGMHEIYIYDDYCYYLHVPIEYENKISQVSSRNVLINFSSDVYLSIKVLDYYASLDRETKAVTDRKDYDLGSELLDETYNNQEYSVNYAQKMIQSMIGSKNVSGVTKTTINGKTFWMVSFEVFSEKTDRLTNVVTKTFKGEGKIYFTVDDGYLYEIMLCANNGYISDAPDAIDALNDFHIGSKIGNSVIMLWVLIGILMVACIAYVASRFVKVEVVEDEKGPDTSTDTLAIDDIRKVIKDESKYDKAQKEHDELLYKLDLILGRVSAPDFDIQSQLERNAQVKEKLDKIMKEHESSVHQESRVDYSSVLDNILGRGESETSGSAEADDISSAEAVVETEDIEATVKLEEIIKECEVDSNIDSKQNYSELLDIILERNSIK